MFGPRKHMLQIAAVIAAALFLYIGGAFAVFDMRYPAYAFDEETHNGRAVALGPHPRKWACKPTYHGIHFDGSEWPFRVFQPICAIWRLTKGYESPAEWRSR